MGNPDQQSRTKIEQAKRHWHRTIGEYITICAGVLLSILAIALGLNYGNANSLKLPGVTGQYVIKHDNVTETTPVLFVKLNTTSLYNARSRILTEAISSYHGASVTIVDDYYDTPEFTAGGHVIFVFGDAKIDDLEGLRVLLHRMKGRNIPVYWLGGGFNQVADIFGVSPTAESNLSVTPSSTDLLYKGVKLAGSGLHFTRYETEKLPLPGKVLAKIKLHQTFERAAIIQNQNLIHSAFIPFSDNHAPLALAVVMDTLSNFTGRHQRRPRVIFRLEDINGKDHDQYDSSFRNTMDYLLSQGIYPEIGIIPRVVNEHGEIEADIDNATPVLEVARQYPEKIGIIQHGFRHFREDPRNEGMGSGDGFEFFFDDDETMGPEVAREFAREVIVKGHELMVASGLSPRMFEAPHYVMSRSEQEIAEEMYPLMQHEPLFFDEGQYGFTLPWLTQRNSVVYAPAAAGYVDYSNPNSISDILDILKNGAAVLPDPVYMVFFHPFITEMPGRETDLADLVEGIRALGYEFDNMLSMTAPLESDAVMNDNGD